MHGILHKGGWRNKPEDYLPIVDRAAQLKQARTLERRTRVDRFISEITAV